MNERGKHLDEISIDALCAPISATVQPESAKTTWFGNRVDMSSDKARSNARNSTANKLARAIRKAATRAGK